jgi:serine/threonine-protein kinase
MQLQALIDGTLSGDEEQTLNDHLEGCAVCRALIDGWADPSGVLEGLAPPNEQRPRSPVLQDVLNAMRTRGKELAAGATLTAADFAAAAGTAPTVADDDPHELTVPPARGRSDRSGSPVRVGPYEVIGEIGRGGMGVVLEALDRALNRVIAVKLLAPELANSAQARRRFLREARAAAAVCHEHVVTIHAVDECDGVPCIVMRYVAGQSLQEKIDREGPLGLEVILRLGMQVAAGLAAAHAQGLVHRDSKPANILLENGVERARITDFGLARAATDARLTRSGTLAGTPQYMAPEQARGEDVDHRTDLFSLGGVLYAIATSKAPFEADSAVAVLRQVSDTPHRPIASLNPALPTWLGAVIDRLMAKDPAARYQSAAEVAEPKQEPSERDIRPHGRKMPLLAALALVTLIALALIVARRDRRISRPGAASAPAPAAVNPPADAALKTAVPVETPPDLLTLGLTANDRKNYAEAVRCLSVFLERNPESPRALRARGDAHRYLKDYKAALEDYDALIRAAPRDSEGYYARAFILVENDRTIIGNRIAKPWQRDACGNGDFSQTITYRHLDSRGITVFRRAGR